VRDLVDALCQRFQRGVSAGYLGAQPAEAGQLVNATPWLKELYEEQLAWIFPCYELEFLLVKMD
jgi:hypothetical protein